MRRQAATDDEDFHEDFSSFDLAPSLSHSFFREKLFKGDILRSSYLKHPAEGVGTDNCSLFVSGPKNSIY